ncbi:E3 ubiquitin-protein ligase ORTHRUS 3 [Frankliniella fusca]|uniref:E3 ubiquitin-protein ligase ORTHRUS 3 n=1 Tax=Frankliniella fusca TaxID=407009 RepID=A0AAE1HQJ2_9NEOP|nr:E3 ubiquitin-protein ligase ORTHRUS 3 [Frankliniella fusca]KAK3925529.1 E3 ubiquitin-protein ligase ORTHRUS 3 [Frankliniella fusca]
MEDGAKRRGEKRRRPHTTIRYVLTSLQFSMKCLLIPVRLLCEIVLYVLWYLRSNQCNVYVRLRCFALNIS